jgi:hypothetical protein
MQFVVSFTQPVTDEVRKKTHYLMLLYARERAHAKPEDVTFEWEEGRVIATCPDMTDKHVFEYIKSTPKQACFQCWCGLPKRCPLVDGVINFAAGELV